MRQLIITGNITKDLELKVGKDKGTSYTRFTVANNDRKDNVIFMRVSAFGKTAELASEYLHKGSKCLIVGSIATGKYTTDEGKEVDYTEVIADRVEFLDSKKSEGEPSKSIADMESDVPF